MTNAEILAYDPQAFDYPASPFQNAAAESSIIQGDANDKRLASIERLRRAGNYVVIVEMARYCRTTDGLLPGTDTSRVWAGTDLNEAKAHARQAQSDFEQDGLVRLQGPRS